MFRFKHQTVLSESNLTTILIKKKIRISNSSSLRQKNLTT